MPVHFDSKFSKIKFICTRVSVIPDEADIVISVLNKNDLFLTSNDPFDIGTSPCIEIFICVCLAMDVQMKLRPVQIVQVIGNDSYAMTK